VLIAFFGGAAGMIGLTRKEPTTLIPGVAIATALMPPLCTAGYGLATGQASFFLGAFFLFTINSVFIALATLGITRVLRLPLHAHADEATRRRRRWIIGVVVLLTVLPSIYLAVELVRHEWFASRAQRYVASLEDDDRSLVVLDSNIDPRRRLIQITPLGEAITLERQRDLEARLPAFGLADATLEIRGPATRPTSAAAASTSDVQRRMQVQLQEYDSRLVELEARLGEAQSEAADLSRLGEEIHAQLPNAQEVQVLQAAGSTPAGRRLIVLLEMPRAVPPQEVTRLERWLAVRVPDMQIELVIGHKVGAVNPDAPGT
jgi:nitrogen fixation/metabolism regulation signal transduction histidine kinase